MNQLSPDPTRSIRCAASFHDGGNRRSFTDEGTLNRIATESNEDRQLHLVRYSVGRDRFAKRTGQVEYGSRQVLASGLSELSYE